LLFCDGNDLTAPSYVKSETMRLYDQGNYSTSVNYCLRVLNSYPKDEQLLLYLAYSYQNLGLYHKAEKTYLDLLAISPFNPHAVKGLSTLYFSLMYGALKSGNINLAFDYIKKGEYYLPGINEFFSEDASLNMGLGNFADAAKLWWTAWEIESASVEKKLSDGMWKLQNMCMCYRKLGKEYVKDWKNNIFPLLKKDPDNRDLLNLAADIYFYNNEEPVKRNRMRNRAMEIYLKTAGERPIIALDFPAKGDWIITSGPFEGLVDTHNGYSSQNIDMMKVDDRGRTLLCGNGRNNSDYLAFGENVYAAYDGIVEAAASSTEDNKVGSKNFTSTNYVQIRHNINGNKYYTQYIHLEKGSVTVSAGEHVKEGQLLGKVGNSGISSAPHLHFGFMDSNKISLPIYFKEASLRRSGSDVPNEKMLISPVRNMVIHND
jgi:tetratricopeptide (TPR) repeat protein